MKRFLRTFSPTGWVLIAAVAVIAFVGLGLMRPTFLGLQFDPFGMDRRKIDSLTTARDAAVSDGIARGLEVEGEREQAARLDTFHTQVIEVRDLTARAETQARSAADANDPLPADRASRLREHDDGLCDVSPTICRSPEADPPGRRDDAL